MKRLLRAIEVLAWFAFFAFAALVLALRYWVLPDVERYRPDIVAAISAAVGLQVKVGAIEAGWQGLRPQLRFSDVHLADAAGREVLVLPSVENVLSWRSLVYRDLRAHSLVVEGPRLTVRRDAAGVLHVAGIALTGGEGGGFGEWLLAQEEIIVRNAEIEWRDEKRGAPPLALDALNLRLRSIGGRHQLGLTARPGAELGPSLEMRAELVVRSPRDAAAWNGLVYAELGYTDLAAWRAWVDYPLDIRRGQGALRLWLALQGGRLARATADVALERVSAQLGDDLPPLELASVRGRLQGRVLSGGYELGARSLALAAEDGPPMQPTDFQLRWTRAVTGFEQGVLSARLIEFEPLAHLAGSLPLPQALRARLAELEPRGGLADARLEWQGPVAEPQRYSARARLDGLSMRPWGAIPGFEGISGSFELSESRGSLYLAARDATLDLPEVFPEPRLAFDALSGRIEWDHVGSAVSVRIASLAFANGHLAGTAFGSWSRVGGGPGRIDLSAQLTRADGRHTARYLPRPGIMGGATRAWLASSILAGDAADVHLRLRGDLRQFPFRDPAQGEFSVVARIARGELKYADDWPAIRNIQCDLVFERDRMEIVGRSGAILGARLANVRVSIPRLGDEAPQLLISGQAEGPSDEFLKFIEASPVKARTGGLTARMAAAGNGRLHLKLELPLRSLAKSRIDGDYEFAGNTIQLPHELPALERASGRIGFSESGLEVQGVRGRIFGGPVEVSGGSRAGGPVELVARGEATVQDTRALFDHPLRAHLSGASAYTARVELREGTARVRVESSLRGVTSTLPPPLDKSAGEALPLRVEIVPLAGGARERITLALGERLAAEVQRQRRGAEPPRAAVWFSPEGGEPIRLPERPGTLVYGTLAAFDADRWMTLEAGGGAAAPTALDLRLGILEAYGKRLHNVVLRAGAEAEGWAASIASNEMTGDVAYRAEDGGRLVARLAQLTIPVDRPGAPGAQARRPRDLPAVDVIAERFIHLGRDLGRLEVTAQRVGEDWRVDKLELASPDGTFSARGSWLGGAAPRTSVQFELDAADAGALLERLGQEGLVRGGRARLSGALGWNGLPVALDYPSLAGDLELHAQDGQFLEVEPGIGKLVALMSLQALPRRITLDFRDVFSQGFRFDRIDAASRLEGGVAALKSFRMRGSAADVQMSGEVDLAQETQALRVRVVPSLGDSASTAVAIVNPVAGVAAAIAQRVLKNPLGQIFAYDYSIRGSWQDPKVERLAKAPAVSEPFAP